MALHRCVDDIAPENRERFEKNYPRYREAPSNKIIDIVAHDDATTFGDAEKMRGTGR